LANYFRALMHQAPLPYGYGAERMPWKSQYFIWLWTRHRIVSKQRYAAWRAQPWLHGSIHNALLCIHRYEGAWNDPNAPYWGGLQMDVSFMQAYNPSAYARWGTADNWPVVEQLEAGYRAVVSGRGFGPWPNTRLMCGV
jgi:hypothetical protein